MPAKRRATRLEDKPSLTQTKIAEPLAQDKPKKTASKNASKTHPKTRSTTERSLMTRSTSLQREPKLKKVTVPERRIYNLRPRKADPTNNPLENPVAVPEKVDHSIGKTNPRKTVVKKKAETASKATEPVEPENSKTAIDPIEAWANQITGEVPIEESSIQESLRSAREADLAAWSRYYGYEPSEDSDIMATRTPSNNTEPDSSHAQSTLTKNKTRTSPIGPQQSKFLDGLIERNVAIEIEPDPRRVEFKEMIVENLSIRTTTTQETNWQKDLTKNDMSDEINFQHTIMVDLIDRHELPDQLDYVCDGQWKCERMPRSVPRGLEPILLSLPKPDLAVAFKTREIIDPFCVKDLGDLRSHLCPEQSKEYKLSRAFHFFAVEVKAPNATDGPTIGNRQNFNTASQALHNIWMFMKKADLEESFFEDVRFFSMMATSKGFSIRMHRAVIIQKGRINKDYPLGFKFDVIHEEDGKYTREKVSGMVRNILLKYGVKKLLPILSRTVNIVTEKLENESPPLSPRKRGPEEPLQSSFSSVRRKATELNLEDRQPTLEAQQTIVVE